MRKLSLILTATLFLIFVVGLAAQNTAYGDIEVDPLAYDFGNVELGTSRYIIFSVSNTGYFSIIIDDISF